ADRRDREIARSLGDLEIGEDRIGEAAIFAMMAQRALGSSRGAAGVVQRRDIVRAGEAARGGAAAALDRGEQIGAVTCGPDREHGLQALRPRRKLAAAVTEG